MKKISVLICALMIFATVFCGCSKKVVPTPTPTIPMVTESPLTSPDKEVLPDGDKLPNESPVPNGKAAPRSHGM